MASAAASTSGQKRPAEAEPEGNPDDKLTFQPLGAGQEVGRSCHILKYKGKTIMLDCGVHPGEKGLESLPYTGYLDVEEIDLLLVTHFHVDHCAAVPWLMERTTFAGKVYMTHPTKAIFRWVLDDYIRVSNIGAESQLYDERDIQNAMGKIETIDFHQTVDVGGIKITPYHAGHVLGACMFMIEIAGVKVMYTGDYSREEDRHLMQAELVKDKPDILITESTFGTHVHEPRDAREARFTAAVSSIVRRGGRCLIPVFAVGRAQELLLILDEYWERNAELRSSKIPIYFASQLAKKCMKAFIGFPNAMNMHIRERMKDPRSNPFHFKHVSELRSAAHLDDSGPSVVLASPGMLQNSTSRELFEAWCTDPKNGIIIAGYSVEGTLAKEISTESVDKIDTLGGQKLPLRMSVESISFAAHVDYVQNRDFVRATSAPKVILVHGEQNEMLKFKTGLERHFESDTDYNFNVYNPENLEELAFYFRGEKMAKVIGKACAVMRDVGDGRSTIDGAELEGGKKKRSLVGTVISGLLVNPVSTFNYHIYDPSELTEHTDLKTSKLMQHQVVAFPHGFGFLEHFMALMHGNAVKSVGRETLEIVGKVKMIHDGSAKTVTLSWVASAENDMWADSVLATIMHIEDSPASIKISQPHSHHDHSHDKPAAMEEDGQPVEDQVLRIDPKTQASRFVNFETFRTKLCDFLRDHYGGAECTLMDDQGADGATIRVTVDSLDATILVTKGAGSEGLPVLSVESTDETLEQGVSRACEKFKQTAEPFFVL